jgi:diacylglycerol kinase (ATP)
MKGLPFLRRLGFALAGLKLAARRERSFRFHLLAGAMVLGLLLATRPAPLWWALLGLATGLVLMAELFNSALETLLDHLHPDRHPAIGAAKDLAAGAVLVASVVALVVGLAFLLR